MSDAPNTAERAKWTTVHWGYGAGLAVCRTCWALVLPDDTLMHDKWHEQQAQGEPS